MTEVPPLDRSRHRVPLQGKVSLKFKEFRGFINEVSSNISLGGMFIVTDRPQPAGTIFDFEMGLNDELTLLQGIGQVAWIRDLAQGPDRPAGMGVRFLELSPESRRLVERMVDEHIKSGGVPFDVETSPAPEPPPGSAVTGSEALPALDLGPLPSPTEAAPEVYPLLGTGHLTRGRVIWPEEDALAPEAGSDTPPGPAPPADTPSRDEPGLAAFEPPPRTEPLYRPLASESPPPPARDLPPGFDEVRRAFSAPAESETAWPAPVPASHAPVAASPEESAAPWPPHAHTWDSDAPPRRRSQRPFWIVAALLLVGGSVGAVWLVAPQLLPWTASATGTDEVAAAAVPPAASGESTAEPAPGTDLAATPSAPAVPLPPEEEAESPLATDLPLTRVEEITWERRGDVTVVVLQGDGGFGPEAFSHYHLDGGTPRELIKLRGIERSYPAPELPAGTPELTRVRTGYHEKREGNELHVVLDLAAPEVEVTAIEPQGTRLVVVLARKA